MKAPLSRHYWLFDKISWLLIGLLTGLSIFLPWKWNILMDEATYTRTMPAYASITDGASRLLQAYFTSGRFYPVKFMANLLEWRLLPNSPVLFHINHFALTLATLLIGWYAAVSRKGDSELKFGWAAAPFFVASAILAKPILDMVVFLSIGESWAAFFLALGIFFLSRDRFVLARFFWLLAAGCKEPVAGVFACSMAYTLLGWTGLPGSNWKKAGLLLCDFFTFLALAFAYSMIMRSGTYLEGYSLISLAGLKNWIYSLMRFGFFALPLVLLACWAVWQSPSILVKVIYQPLDRAWHAFLLLFTLGYLLVVTPRGVSGYLQIPAALTFLLLIVPFALKGIELLGKRAIGLSAIFATLFIGFALFSLQRWSSYANGINDVSMVFRELIRTEHPRLLLVHGGEGRGYLEEEAIQSGLSHVLVKDASLDGLEEAKEFKGEVILLDPIRYFEPLPKALTNEIGSRIGGWRHISRLSSGYRAYYGIKD